MSGKPVRPNHGNQIPRLHIVVDTETTPESIPGHPGCCYHRLRLGSATAFRYDDYRPTRIRQLDFKDQNTFWNWTLGLWPGKRQVTVWCHNAGFDLSVLRLWDMMEHGEFSLRFQPTGTTTEHDQNGPSREFRGVFIDEDPPTIIVLRHQSGRVYRFLDTMNFIPVSLAKIGRLIGRPKLEMPGEIASDADWLAYCRRDVDLTAEAVWRLLALVDKHDLGNFRPTCAAQGWHWWRHGNLTEEVKLPEDEKCKALERLAYTGARRECYFSGAVIHPRAAGLESFYGFGRGARVLPAGPVYRLDMVCAYPYLMRGEAYPVEYLSGPRAYEPAKLLLAMEQFGAVADVSVNDGNHTWPMRKDGRTVWCLGRFRTQLCGPELQRALRWRVVTEVHGAQLYRLGRPFGQLMDKGLSLRKQLEEEGAGFEAQVVKMVLNSLHGRFAMRRPQWQTLSKETAPHPWGPFWRTNAKTGKKCLARSLAWLAQEARTDTEHPQSFPAIPAYVLAYFRERMRQARDCAGERAVLYEDADSIHVTEAGFRRLDSGGWIDGDKPGHFRVEQVALVAVYNGPRDYRLDDHVVCGGLSGKAEKDAHGEWHQTEFLSLSSIVSGAPPAGPLSFERTLAQPVHEIVGAVGVDGWVAPLVIN